MKIFPKILFATDLTKQTDKISHYVRYMAQLFDSELHVISVMEPPPDPLVLYHDMLDDSILESYERELQKQIETALRKTVERHFSNLNVKIAVLLGPVAEKIITYAKEYGISLIIMGSATKEGITEKIFGSNASKVIANSPCPVMTINPAKITE